MTGSRLTRAPWIAAAAIFLIAPLLTEGIAAQGRADGSISGRVFGSDSLAVADALVEISSPELATMRSVRSDSAGAFRVQALPAGLYAITVRRLGYQSATLTGLRVIAGRETDVRVELTQSATRLSTVSVVSSALQIDLTTTAISERISAQTAALLPTARDAASLVALVPGVRVGQAWGGAGDLANNVQLDGISVGHPGAGGDFLRPSVDWIESLEVLGLGAGAEHGNFQGGIINAVTRSGGNVNKGAFRSNLESVHLSGTNFNLREEGSEQAERREVSGEFGGPIVADKLHYFVAAQFLGRALRVPDLLTSNTAVGFRPDQTTIDEFRGFAKLTWYPEAGSRVDFLLGGGNTETERFGLTGADAPSSTQRVQAPLVFYSANFLRDAGTRHSFDVRLAGYVARERRDGYEGPTVPGVRAYSLGREPGFQNADFSERRHPSSLSLKGSWTMAFDAPYTSHRLKSGIELGGGRWENRLTRNGGMTWRPFPDPNVGYVDPSDPSTWAVAGSEWGGELQLKAESRNAALFVQDEISVLSRVTLTPGIRWSAWEGLLDSRTGPDPSVRSTGWDPRLGVVWDALGDGTLALKAHWGRYHQGMAAALFDRLAGAQVYTNERLYTLGPTITDSRTTFTPAQRDSAFIDPTGTGYSFNEKRFDETGVASGYRQPYVDQLVFAVEKTLGPHWKAEAVFTQRRNYDMVGLLDRNLASNHTPIRNVAVRPRFGGVIGHPNGGLLTLPVVWISNIDLRNALIAIRDRDDPPPPGFSFDTIATLIYNPDFVLTALPDAKRHFRQAYIALRTEYPRWSAMGSFAYTELTGNVEGVTGYGGSGSGFRAGQWVRPNEGINGAGDLSGTPRLEAKMWGGLRLGWGLQAGATITHITGERITPYFEMEGFRYRLTTEQFGGEEYPGEVFEGADGQTFYLERLGRRGYADRTVLDLHLERSFASGNQRWLVTLDLFNALGEDEITNVNVQVTDSYSADPTALYGAPRQRVAPRRLRIGTRVEF